MRKTISAICIAIVVFFNIASAQNPPTLLSFDSIRSKLLNQVILTYDGENYSSQPRDALTSMGNWMIAKKISESGYKLSIPGTAFSSPAIPIVGKTALVLSVELSSAVENDGPNRIDMFGKAVELTKALDPEVTVVAQLEDGDKLIGVTGRFSSIYGRSLMLPPDAARLKNDVHSYITSKIGSTIYNVRYTELLPPSLDINEIVSYSIRKEKRDRETPNLLPLKVIDAMYLDSDNAVVLKVALPSGEARLIFGSLEHYYLKRDYKPTQFERMNISALEKSALRFTRSEMDAIKKRNIFRGMSRDALWASWGYEDKSNDWGIGGEQKIFHGSIFVYLKNNSVRDWQMLQ